jgi:two-component system cell cycle sensor histidine kinase/response regulator CckA
VILDLAMPGMRGAEVFREIVSIRPSAKVILASGYAVQPQPLRFGDAEPVAFLTKPFAMDTLIGTIQDVLAGNGAATTAHAPAHIQSPITH